MYKKYEKRFPSNNKRSPKSIERDQVEIIQGNSQRTDVEKTVHRSEENPILEFTFTELTLNSHKNLLIQLNSKTCHTIRSKSFKIKKKR